MGNYYEGSFYVKLKQIPKTLEEIIVGINNGKFHDSHPLFNSEHNYTNLGIESGVILYLKDFAMEKFDYKVSDEARFLDLSFESYNELLTEDNDILKDYDKKGFYIRASVNTKRYNQELELFLDYIKDYLDKDSNPLVVGHIEDEDGYCKKDLVIDEEKFQQILNSQDYLCSGCEYRMKHCFCENYNLCKRAYDLGCKNKED